MNACGAASFTRERERCGQGRHLHEARPHAWVRIRSRLRQRWQDIWCSSLLRVTEKRRVPAVQILLKTSKSESREKERNRETRSVFAQSAVASLPQRGGKGEKLARVRV